MSQSSVFSNQAKQWFAPLATPTRIGHQNWPDGTVPFVSILCFAYNHAEFIAQCLDGFLLQETTFPVEIIVHDDASTDGTQGIIESYHQAYPQLIRIVLQKENIYRKCRHRMLDICMEAASGEYMAICEGDDYWTSPSKLEKQARILQQDSSISLVFHNCWVRYVDSTKDYLMNQNLGKDRFTIDDVLSMDWFIATASIMIRTIHLSIPECLRFSHGGDIIMHMMAALNGEIRYLDEVGGVYRRHSGGVSDPFWTNPRLYIEELAPNQIWVLWVFDKQVSGGRGHQSLMYAIKVRLKRIVNGRLLTSNTDTPPNINYLRESVCNLLARAKPEGQIADLETVPEFAILMDSAIADCMLEDYRRRISKYLRDGRFYSCIKIIAMAIAGKTLTWTQLAGIGRKYFTRKLGYRQNETLHG